MIFAVSLYMIWERRIKIGQLRIKSSLFPGSIITICGCFMFLIGRMSSTWLVEGLALIVSILGLIWMLLGREIIRILLIPVGYLAFMLPLFDETLSSFSPFLQQVAAWIAANLLTLIGFSVYQSAQYVMLPYITLEVAKACNGINHISALVALAVPVAFLTQDTWLKRWVLIVSSFFIGIFANGLRVAIIGILAKYKSGPLHGPGDFLYVSFIFFFGLFVLLLMSHIMGKDRGEKKFLVELHRDEKNPIRQGFLKGNFNFTMVVATLILAFFGSYAYLHRNHPIILKKPLSEFPAVVDSWIGQDLKRKVRYFVSSSDNVSLHRVYRNNQYGKAIELHMIYFPMQDRNNKVINFPPDSLYSLAKEVQIPVENEMVKVRKAIIQEEGKNKGVLFWWDVNGRVIADRFQTKLATILDSLLNRKTNAGLVFVITNTSDGNDPQNKTVENAEEKFIRDFIPLTRDYLNPAR